MLWWYSAYKYRLALLGFIIVLNHLYFLGFLFKNMYVIIFIRFWQYEILCKIKSSSVGGWVIMWEIIKYMFYCLSLFISAAFGNNPDGLTWVTGLIGFGTLVLIILLAALLFYCILLINYYFFTDRRKK